jgi:hypothetical protein
MKKRGQFTLAVGDKELNGHFSMSFLYSLCDIKKMELHEIHLFISKVNDAVGLSEIIFAAHKAHSLRTNEKLVFENQFILLDELFENGIVNDENSLAGVYEALRESVLFQNVENGDTGLTRTAKKDSKDPK